MSGWSLTSGEEIVSEVEIGGRADGADIVEEGWFPKGGALAESHISRNAGRQDERTEVVGDLLFDAFLLTRVVRKSRLQRALEK